jgi:hypothetical protein
LQRHTKWRNEQIVFTITQVAAFFNFGATHLLSKEPIPSSNPLIPSCPCPNCISLPPINLQKYIWYTILFDLKLFLQNPSPNHKP